MPSQSSRTPLIFATVCITSFATTLLTMGFVFYTEHLFGWGLRANFMLTAAQGTVYIIASLQASRLTAKFGRRGTLSLLYVLLALGALAAVLHSTPVFLTGIVILYTFVMGATWPMLESIVSTSAPAHGLSRQLGLYNLLWSSTCALALAISGSLIQNAPAGLFLVPMVFHIICAGAILASRKRGERQTIGAGDQTPHVTPEPELIAHRRLALWLSRIALPAAYVVVYSLVPMLASMPALRGLSPRLKTLVSSIWLGSRVIAFAYFGFTSWWHTRPKLLLYSAVLMFISFLGTVVPGLARGGEDGSVPVMALLVMSLAQVALGLSMGMIYTASLYFGMALSEGSTEHGGYHEALIGVGMVMGPAAGALSQFGSGSAFLPAIIAVAAVIATALVAAILVARRAELHSLASTG
jgi:MFS family permease